MPTQQKEALIAEIRERLDGSAGLILADYRGLSVKDMQELRGKMREAGAELTVYKNRLARIAVGELGLPEGLSELLVGPTLFAFVSGEPVAPAKAFAAFAKAHAALQVKGGIVDAAFVDADGMKAVAALASREELIAKLLGTMLNPVTGFARVLNGPASAFVRVLSTVADLKAAA